MACAFVAACGTAPDNALAAAPTCLPPMGEGFSVGEPIADLAVSRCDGTETNLRDLSCGHRLTLMDIGAAAFRACVEATELYARDAEFDALQAEGLNIVQVFLGNERFEVPTLEFCSEYSVRHQVDFDFVIDPPGETGLFSPVHPINLVIDHEGRILHKWSPMIPADRVEILWQLLHETL